MNVHGRGDLGRYDGAGAGVVVGRMRVGAVPNNRFGQEFGVRHGVRIKLILLFALILIRIPRVVVGSGGARSHLDR